MMRVGQTLELGKSLDGMEKGLAHQQSEECGARATSGRAADGLGSRSTGEPLGKLKRSLQNRAQRAEFL